MTGTLARWTRFTVAGAAGFVVQLGVLATLTAFTERLMDRIAGVG